MNILPQYKGFRTATQKLFLLNRPFPSAFSRTIFHICSVLKLLETICSNAHFKSGVSNSWGAMNFFLPSVILLTYPKGAVPIYRPSFFALRTGFHRGKNDGLPVILYSCLPFGMPSCIPAFLQSCTLSFNITIGSGCLPTGLRD